MEEQGEEALQLPTTEELSSEELGQVGGGGFYGDGQLL